MTCPQAHFTVSVKLLASRIRLVGYCPVGTAWFSGKAWILFRAGARVTFFGAKKVTKENTQVQGKFAAF